MKVPINNLCSIAVPLQDISQVHAQIIEMI